ncbi:MAG TPA: O-antigen ligase family protein, partial [Longimicrobium sp.]
MSSALFALWFATLGADRFDLLAAEGSVKLGPALLLTPILVALEIFRLMRQGGKFRVPRNAVAYTLVASTFLSVVLLSVLYSFDMEMSAKRYALLAFHVYSTLIVAMALAQRPDARDLLVRGAYWGLALGTFSNIFQVASWFIWGDDEIKFLGGVLDMTLNVYSGVIPRLSAQAYDMNRGGILLLVYSYLLVRLAPPSKVRTLCVAAGLLGMLLTLSRSVMLGLLGTVIALLLSGRRLRITRRRMVGSALTLAAICAVLIASPRASSTVADALEPLGQRFSAREGSASVHLRLIDRGVEIATKSPKNAVVGIGYGNSFAYLQDLFPGDKYGNFHSLYLTLLTECGGLALLLGVALIAFGAFKGGVYIPLVAGFAFFNIFYQTSAEAIFWFSLVLGWTRLGDPTLEARIAPAPAVPLPRATVPAPG